MHDGETPTGNQSTAAIQMSLANLKKHLENIDHTISVLDMQTKGVHSDTKPDNLPRDDYIEKLKERVKKLKDPNNKIHK